MRNIPGPESLEWTDILLIIGLVAYGLHRLRVTIFSTMTRARKTAYVAIHVASALIGWCLSRDVWGFTLGLSGAGIVGFIEEFVRARFGAPVAPPAPTDDGPDHG
jgi:hypothetical protein